MRIQVVAADTKGTFHPIKVHLGSTVTALSKADALDLIEELQVAVGNVKDEQSESGKEYERMLAVGKRYQLTGDLNVFRG